MTTNIFEAEVSGGLEQLAAQELIDKHLFHDIKSQKGAVQFKGQLENTTKSISIVNSVYMLLYYKIPRPKALLGHEHFQRLIGAIQAVRSVNDKKAFSDFYISAAGSHTSVMQRIKTEISNNINLPEGDETGDLLVRIRRNHKSGWEVLIRVTPRPHATRQWRKCNYEGALNAPTAHAMIALSKPTPHDTVINLACGSGTLMIERLLHKSANLVLGFDNHHLALDCASENMATAQLDGRINLFNADIRQLPLSDDFATHLYTDLPFGQLVGSHEENLKHYPQIMEEAARICKINGIFTILTHEIKLIEKILEESTYWSIQNMVKITQRGLHPRIYMLKRR